MMIGQDRPPVRRDVPDQMQAAAVRVRQHTAPRTPRPPSRGLHQQLQLTRRLSGAEHHELRRSISAERWPLVGSPSSLGLPWSPFLGRYGSRRSQSRFARYSSACHGTTSTVHGEEPLIRTDNPQDRHVINWS